MRAVMQTDEILSTLHEIRADILVVRGKVDATQADLTRVETKLSALASKVEGMNDKVTTQEVQDAAQQKQIELLGTSVAAVKAKQVGWASLAWAIGVGAFYLIQLLLGGKLPAIGQPPTIQHLPLPPGITAPLDSVAGCLRLPVYKPADSVIVHENADAGVRGRGCGAGAGCPGGAAAGWGAVDQDTSGGSGGVGGPLPYDPCCRWGVCVQGEEGIRVACGAP